MHSLISQSSIRKSFTSQSTLFLSLLTCCAATVSAQAYPPIQQDITLNVPSLAESANALGAVCPQGMQQIKTIQDALACLDAVVIAASAKVTIALTEQPEFFYDTIVVQHRDARQLAIVGACPEGLPCVLTFHDNINGVLIDGGITLGKLANLELRGRNHQAYGVYIARNSSLLEGQQLDASGFATGFFVHRNSEATFTDSRAHENGHGFWSEDHSSILGYRLTANHNDANGFQSDWLSTFSLYDHSVAQGNGTYGAATYALSFTYCDMSCQLQNHHEDGTSGFSQW